MDHMLATDYATVVAVDYETFYDTKNNYSVKINGTTGYLQHPKFDAYLVSVVLYDHQAHAGGVMDNLDMVQECCGHPAEFDWDSICGPDHLWLSHNKSFDYSVHQHLVTTGVLPPHPYPRLGADNGNWHCTADLTSYMGMPRALAAVVKFLYGGTMNKTVRDNMDGRTWDSLNPDERDELIEYALDDSRVLHRLWESLGKSWPDQERRISDLTVEMGNRGFPVCPQALAKASRDIKAAQAKAEDTIPWDWRGAKNKTPLSSKMMAEQCRKDGLEPPRSRAKDDLECQRWVTKHGDKAPYVQAMQDWGSANTLINRLDTMSDRLVIDESTNWGWVPYGLRVNGTHTGRDAGTGGLNVLNMNKTEVHGVDLRGIIKPPPGHVFLSADYSQIEPRVLAWLTDDTVLLDALRKGGDPYVAFGTGTLGHKGGWTPKNRQIWKVMVLGLSYGCGAQQFVDYALSKGKLELTLPESKRLVDLYRTKNRRVTDLWKSLEKNLRDASMDRILIVELPTGRPLIYRSISRLKGLCAVVADEYGFVEKKFWGGMLCENLVQAVARDAFFEGYLKLEAHGIPVVLRIYDEFLSLAREEEAEEKAVLMKQLMEAPLPWAPGLPIAAEVKILTAYEK